MSISVMSTTTTYRIISRAGQDMGLWVAESAEAAFAAMVADGGDGEDSDGRSTAGSASDWIIEEDVDADEARAAAYPGGPQQVHSGWVWYIDGGREPFKASTRAELLRIVVEAVERVGVEAAFEEGA